MDSEGDEYVVVKKRGGETAYKAGADWVKTKVEAEGYSEETARSFSESGNRGRDGWSYDYLMRVT